MFLHLKSTYFLLFGAGCTYENEQYRNGAVFRSKSRPCDQCQCRDGTVTCGTRSCPSLGMCRQPITVEGACCPVCLSCGNRRNGEEWNQDECTVCRCNVSQSCPKCKASGWFRLAVSTQYGRLISKLYKCNLLQSLSQNFIVDDVATFTTYFKFPCSLE